MENKLPIGIESFEEIRTAGFYYVDKTGLIKELLQNWGKVNLFTRPRRFGKSLNMSMLKCFLEIGCRPELFDGLKIAGETALCEEYMGKFPVVSVSLKGINAGSYETARDMAVRIINEEARRFQYLLDSKQLTQHDKEAFTPLLRGDMSEAVLCGSLRCLSELLQKHHGQKVVMLIDEYDIPLAKVSGKGYYDEMAALIQNIFEQALKTNESLHFAVLTGCLRVAKESIFTGLNNLKVLSIRDVRFDEYFGFTDNEVRGLLAYYNLSEFYGTVKEWYDGYRFGNMDVYCPWDVICYCDALRSDHRAQPEEYWSNTSSNDIIKHFLKSSDSSTRREIEKLLSGETITKEIHQELTYKELYDTIDNIWSVLFTTGYLTQKGEPDGKRLHLAIPNAEIKNIFSRQVSSWFQDAARQNSDALNAFCEAFKNGDAVSVENQFNAYLKKTISVRDTFVKKAMKENFYHGILLGLLSFKSSWEISSNRESGDGYSDIQIEIEEDRIGIVIEVKYCETGNLDVSCHEALEQIEENKYTEYLYDAGMKKVLKYGIACYKKHCKVALG